jgi:hypothetical protein
MKEKETIGVLQPVSAIEALDAVARGGQNRPIAIALLKLIR